MKQPPADTPIRRHADTLLSPPLTPHANTPIRRHSDTLLSPPPAHLRILLVDDSPEFLVVATNFLSMEAGFEVIGQCTSAKDALEMVEQLHPDLVIMDLAMPVMNGIEATRKIKEKPEAPDVIILTLYDNPEYRQLSEMAHADGFVTKSEFVVQLIPLINRLFSEPSAKAKVHKEKVTMKNILIVDDSPTMRRMIKASLKGLDEAHLSEAGNGLEAIERIALERFDLMILDLNMPDMHGLEVLSFVRRHNACKNLPILVLTTKSDETSRNAALSTGASMYMTKPFEPDVLAGNACKLLSEEQK